VWKQLKREISNNFKSEDHKWDSSIVVQSYEDINCWKS
jgi:hypothetical protein